jgi:hypothetical protein
MMPVICQHYYLQRVVVYAIAIAFCAHVLLGAGLAHRLPTEQPAEQPVKLSVPLKQGSYYIANGGNHPLLNDRFAFINCPQEAI